MHSENIMGMQDKLKEVGKDYMNTDDSVSQKMHGNTTYWILMKHDMKAVILVKVNLIGNFKFKQVRKLYMNAHNLC